MNDRPTPETDAMIAADQHHLEDDNFFPATVYWRMCDVARTLERERDEAREWKTLLSLWGGTPEIVHDFIKGQQMRIYAAQEVERERDEAQSKIDAICRWISHNCADGLIDSAPLLEQINAILEREIGRREKAIRERSDMVNRLAAVSKLLADVMLERNQAQLEVRAWMDEAARWRDLATPPKPCHANHPT